jgi:hypothetical protein
MVDVKRIGIGLLASVVILLLLDLLPNLVPDQYVAYRLFDHFYVWPGVGGMIAMFVAAFGGAYVSKVRFVVPAAFLAVGVWIFIIYFLNSIAAAAGQGDFLFAASINLLGLILGIVGAVLGAIFGARVAGGFLPATEQ